ncbi:Protein K03E5.2 b [Aphelenchoides avenae]|nr:Protein K03E5.2 b [Aphelenchus avenae]
MTEQDQQPVGLKLAAAKYEAQAAANSSGPRTKSGKFTIAQLRQTDGIVPLQSGTNQFDSQRGKTCFGTPRNTQKKVEFSSEDANRRWQVNDLGQHDNLIRLQAGTNRFDSQKGMNSFGTPRDVKGKHLKRIWELEFPEECIDAEPPVNLAPQQSPQQIAYQQQQQQQYQQQPQQQQQRPGPPPQQQHPQQRAAQQAAPGFR